jgi:hypothetical protein
MMATAIRTQLTTIVLMAAGLTGKPSTSRPTTEVKLFVKADTPRRVSTTPVMLPGVNMQSFRQRRFLCTTNATAKSFKMLKLAR